MATRGRWPTEEKRITMSRNLIRTAAVTVGAAALVGLSGLAAQAAPNTAPEISTTVVAPHSYSDCKLGDLCAYSGPNGTGTKKAWYICQTVKPSPFSSTDGSADNNQTGGAVMVIHNKNGTTYTLKAGYVVTGINWANVSYMVTCP
jgi:hypothetical protein